MKNQTIHKLLTDIYYNIPEAEESVVGQNCEELTANEMHILRIIAVRPQKDAKTIAESLRMGKYAVEGSLDRMKEKGYVTPDLNLTPKGEEALEIYKELIQKGIAAMVHEMSDEEVDTIIRGLGLLNDYIEQLTGVES